MTLATEIINSNEQFKLMTCEETADLLRINIKTLYAWMSRKQIPDKLYRKVCRKPIFIYDEVIEWFLSGANVKKR